MSFLHERRRRSFIPSFLHSFMNPKRRILPIEEYVFWVFHIFPKKED